MPYLDELRSALGSAADGRTDEDLLSLVSKATGRPLLDVAADYNYDPGKGSMWGERLSSSIDRYQSGLYDFGSQAAGAVGLRNWSGLLDERRRANEVQADVAAQRASSLGAVDRWADVHSIGDFGNYAGGLAVQSLPYVGEALVGGMAGRALIGGGEAAMLGFGSAVGAVAGSYPSSVGDVLSNQREQSGTVDFGNAALLGIPYAGLNLLGVEGLAARGQLARVGARTGRYLDDLNGVPGGLARAGVTAAKTGLEEGLSETGQEVVNQMGRIAVDPQATLTDPAALERYGESFAGGAALGGLFGGAGRGWRRSEGYSRPTLDETGNLLDPSNPVGLGSQVPAPPPGPGGVPLTGVAPEVVMPPPPPPAAPVIVAGVDANATAAEVQRLRQEREAATAELGQLIGNPKPKGAQVNLYLEMQGLRGTGGGFTDQEFADTVARLGAGDYAHVRAAIKARKSAIEGENQVKQQGAADGVGAGAGAVAAGSGAGGGADAAGSVAVAGSPAVPGPVALAPAAPGAASLPARVAAIQQPAPVAPSAPLTKAAPEGAAKPSVTVKKVRKVEAKAPEGVKDTNDLKKFLSNLPERDRAIVKDALGADDELHAVESKRLSLRDLAAKYQMSPEGVRKVLARSGLSQKAIENFTGTTMESVSEEEVFGRSTEEGAATGFRVTDRPGDSDDHVDLQPKHVRELEAQATQLLKEGKNLNPKLAVPGSRTEAFLLKKQAEREAAKKAADEALEQRRRAYAAKLREDAERLNKDVQEREEHPDVPIIEPADREGAEADWKGRRFEADNDVHWADLTKEEQERYASNYRALDQGKVDEHHMDAVFEGVNKEAKLRVERAAQAAPVVTGDGTKSAAQVTVRKKRTVVKPEAVNDPQRQKTLVSKAVDRAVAREQGKEVPSKRIHVRGRLNKALKEFDAGRLDENGLAKQVEDLSEDLEEAALDRSLSRKPRERGADYIRERLLQAKRRGDLSERAVEFAEWFILRNEKLLNDLGVSVRTPKGDGRVSGNYDPVRRVMTLMKESSNDQTVVHEVLHHLERMMPAELQEEARTLWAKAVASAAKRAKKEGSITKLAYLDKVLTGVTTGNQKLIQQASDMVAEGKVPYDYYAYLNPSEFWAVNMAAHEEARFDARNSLWEKTKLWLKDALEWAKMVLGLSSKTPMYRALREVMAGSGAFQSNDMLSENGEYNIYAGPNGDMSALEKKRLREAKQMAEQGMNPDTIRTATGWFKGPYDGKWRNEITDKYAKWRQPFEKLEESKLFASTQMEYKLGDVLDHPQLYQMYPTARELKVVKRAGFMDFGGLQGSFDGNQTIQITPYAKDPLSTLLHEVQHWVQEQEGFATGGNENSALDAATPEQLQRQAKQAMEKLQPKLDESAGVLEVLKKAREMPQTVATYRQAQEAFHTAAGAHPEAGHPERKRTYDRANEARDALRRALFGTDRYFDMTPAQRAAETKLTYSDLDEAIKQAEGDFTKVQKQVAGLRSGDPKTLKEAIKAAGLSHQLYTGIAGEIEARDTQARQKLSSAERAVTQPYSSEQFDPRDVIVTYGVGNGNSESSAPQPGSANPGDANAAVQGALQPRTADAKVPDRGRVPAQSAGGAGAGQPPSGAQPAGLGDLPPPPGKPAKLKGWIDSIVAGKWRAAPWLLGALSTEQLATVFKDLPGQGGKALRAFHQGMQRMAQRASSLITESDKIKRQWETLRSRHGAARDEAFTDFLLDSTRRGIWAMHALDTDAEAEDNPNRHLGKVKKLEDGTKVIEYDTATRVMHAQLAQAWRNLHPDYQAFFNTLQQDFQAKYQAKVDGFLQNIVAGHYPATGSNAGLAREVIDRAAQVDKKLRQDFAQAHAHTKLERDTLRSLWNDIDEHAREFPRQMQGPYFPLMRFGDHIVTVKSTAFRAAEAKLAETNKALEAALDSPQSAKAAELEDQLRELKLKHEKTPEAGDPARIIALEDQIKAANEPLVAARKARNQARSALKALKAQEDHYVVEFYETLGEAKARYDQLSSHYAARDDIQVEQKLKDKYLREVDGVTPTFLKKVEDNLASEMPASERTRVRQTMRELYLQMLPETSAMKSQMKRKNVAGVRADQGLRSYAASSVRDAWYISRLENREPVRSALNELRFSDDVDTKLIGNELALRVAQNFHFDNRQWMSAATNLTYMAYLGMSPAFMVTQVTQPWVISAPVMAARHGVQTASQLWRGWKQAAQLLKLNAKGAGLNYTLDPEAGVQAKILTAGEAGLIREMLDSGRIDITITHDLGAAAGGRSEGYLGKAVRMSAWPAQQAELLNRISTALAAYRMEKSRLMKEGSGDAEATRAAREYADKIVAETHLNYAPENRARFMHPNSFGGWGRVMWQFRSYQQGMLYLTFKNLFDAFKGDKEARRAVVYLMGTQLAVAGTSGLPIAFPAGLVATLLYKMFTDDDDEKDLKELYRQSIANVAGDTVATLVTKGAPAAFLGVDLSKRIGMGNIMSPMPFVDEGKEGRDWVAAHWVALTGGAALGYLGNVAEGIKAADQGDWAKAFAWAFPWKVAADFTRGASQAVRGMVDSNGNTILHPEELGLEDAVLKMLGFPSQQVERTRELRNAFFEARQNRADARGAIVRSLVQARLAGEMPDYTEMLAYNQRHPDARITYSDVQAQVKAKRKEQASMQRTGGVPVKKSERGLAREMGID